MLLKLYMKNHSKQKQKKFDFFLNDDPVDQKSWFYHPYMEVQSGDSLGVSLEILLGKLHHVMEIKLTNCVCHTIAMSRFVIVGQQIRESSWSIYTWGGCAVPNYSWLDITKEKKYFNTKKYQLAEKRALKNLKDVFVVTK